MFVLDVSEVARRPLGRGKDVAKISRGRPEANRVPSSLLPSSAIIITAAAFPKLAAGQS